MDPKHTQYQHGPTATLACKMCRPLFCPTVLLSHLATAPSASPCRHLLPLVWLA